MPVVILYKCVNEQNICACLKTVAIIDNTVTTGVIHSNKRHAQ
jgi:hypothetical protein